MRSVYGADLDDSLSVNRLASEVSAMTTMPGGKSVLIASRSGGSSSLLSIIRPDGSVEAYNAIIKGEVTAISVVPNGSRALLAVRRPDPEAYEIVSFPFTEGSPRTVTSLRQDLQVFGSPQWTDKGIYYVAGRETRSIQETSPDYNLYRLTPGSDQPELASGVGEDFVASSLKRNSKGDLLAIVGRRTPSSPANVYVLSPGVGDLVALTANENMEIKTESKDLAWSNDDSRVAIVARTMLSGPRVYDVPADELVSDFYNLYEVPASGTSGDGPE
jgi:dipeptidyl aminopeptidase/acylaminoacyl peptidase